MVEIAHDIAVSPPADTSAIGRLRTATVEIRAFVERPVILNAASLFGTTAVTSALGFAFWVVAARTFPVHSVGVASAAVSAMLLLAQLGIFGLGTLMIGELSERRSPRGLVSAAVIAASVLCLACGGLFLLLLPLWSMDMGPLGQGVVGPLLFVLGVAASGASVVLDQACIGLNRGTLQLRRNIVFAAVKLVLLPCGLLLHSGEAALAVYAVWLAGNLVSFASFALTARRRDLDLPLRPAFRPLAAIRGAALAHHWLNLAAQAPRLLLPVMVAATLSPSLNAAFYTAVLIVGFANIVPAHLSMALFALPRGNVDRLARELRSTLRLSALVGAASAVVFALTAKLCLSLFGPDYTVATSSMIVLGLTTLPYTVKVHYAAVCRVQDRLTWCAAVSTAGGLVEIVCCYVGARTAGLVGVSAGLLAAMCFEAIILWPAVARAAGLRLLSLGRRA